MASKLGNVTEGWEKWEIALAVGAPIALGLAGLWYYKRSRSKDSGKKSESSGDTPKSSARNSESAAGLSQSPVEKAQEAKNKGNKYFKGGRYDQAIECYTEAIRLCPDSQGMDIATFHQNRAAAYEQLKNHDKVIEDCSCALKLNNRYTKAFFRRAKAYEQMQQLSPALEDITAVCILESFQMPQSLQMADRILKDLGNSKAKEAYQKRIPTMPSRQLIRSYFAAFANDPVYRWQKSPSRKESKPFTAGETQTTNHANDPEDSENQENERMEGGVIGEAEKGQGDRNNDQVSKQEVYEPSAFQEARDALLIGEYDDILDLCTRGVEQTDSPDQYLCLLLRATFYLLKGQGTLALADLNTLLDMEDIDKKIKVNALIKRGTLSLQEGKQTEALDDYATAVRVDSGNSDVYHHRGQTSIMEDDLEVEVNRMKQNLLLERIEDAQRDFEKSIRLNPTFAASYVQKCYAEYRQAIVCQSPLQLQAAVKNFDDIVRKFPTSADGHVLYGQALCDQMQYADADEQFLRALAIEPENANSLVHRGLLCLQWKQNIEDAVKLIKEALEMDDKCEFAYETLGTIEVQKGNMKEAIELFNKAINLSKTENEMTHLYSLLHAALAQAKVATDLGLKFPMGMTA